MNPNPIRALLCLCALISGARLNAQDPAVSPAAAPEAPAQPTLSAAAQAPAAQPSAPPNPDQAAQEQEQTTPPPQPPKPQPLPPPKYTPSTVDTGRGLSIEPFYWYGSVKPRLRGGAQDTSTVIAGDGNLDYPGAKQPVYGGILSIPVSKTNMLRFSYFQVTRNAVAFAPQNLSFFGEAATPGVAIGISYKIQNWKASYDYLTYFWTRGNSEFRVKTLWEVQYASMSNSFAFFNPNGDGTYTANTAGGDKSIIFPTFGLALENTMGRHFRWEAKASGFAWPKKSVIGDMEADIAFRVGHVELVAGGKAYHFKTSPQKDEYYKATLYGPYVGLRFYWKKR